MLSLLPVFVVADRKKSVLISLTATTDSFPKFRGDCRVIQQLFVRNEQYPDVFYAHLASSLQSLVNGDYPDNQLVPLHH